MNPSNLSPLFNIFNIIIMVVVVMVMCVRVPACVHVCVYIEKFAHHSVHVKEIRRQHCGVGTFFPPLHWFWEPKSGRQACLVGSCAC